MKTKLLKIIRKRFEVIQFGSHLAVLDHTNKRVVTEIPGSPKIINSSTDAFRCILELLNKSGVLHYQDIAWYYIKRQNRVQKNKYRKALKDNEQAKNNGVA